MGPALAVVELSSIARGHRVADAMLKRAPVRLMRADAISPGKFLVLVEGDVAAVDESFRVGTDVGRRFAPSTSCSCPSLTSRCGPRWRARRTPPKASNRWASSRRRPWPADVRAADAAAKAARVRISEMQLGRGIGGKAFFTVTGLLGEVEAAVEAAVGVLDAALVHTTENHRGAARRLRRETALDLAPCSTGVSGEPTSICRCSRVAACAPSRPGRAARASAPPARPTSTASSSARWRWASTTSRPRAATAPVRSSSAKPWRGHPR
jgi:microcompartment protein CcmL/EutN